MISVSLDLQGLISYWLVYAELESLAACRPFREQYSPRKKQQSSMLGHNVIINEICTEMNHMNENGGAPCAKNCTVVLQACIDFDVTLKMRLCFDCPGWISWWSLDNVTFCLVL